MFENLPYSKWKNMRILTQGSLTIEQMEKLKEDTWNSDWARILPETGTQLTVSMNFTLDMPELISELEDLAAKNPALSFKAEFCHDYFDDEILDMVENEFIGEITVSNGKVSED